MAKKKKIILSVDTLASLDVDTDSLTEDEIIERGKQEFIYLLQNNLADVVIEREEDLE